jgi:hypothetical protein
MDKRPNHRIDFEKIPELGPVGPPSPELAKKILAYVSDYTDWKTVGPWFHDIWDNVSEKDPSLTVPQFQRALKYLREHDQLALGGWPRMPSEMPKPELAFYVQPGSDFLMYAASKSAERSGVRPEQPGRGDAGNGVEASRRELEKYGFARGDIADFERDVKNRSEHRDYQEVVEGIVSNMETGTDANSPEIGNEAQMVRDHLEKYVAANFDVDPRTGSLSPKTKAIPEGQPSRGDVAKGVGPPAGLGTAGGGAVEPPPPPGAPGVSAPQMPAPAQGPQPPPVANWFQRSADFLRSFAQQSFPTLTRMSQPAGEKLAEAANAKVAAKASWDYFSRVLKVTGQSLPEGMSHEEWLAADSPQKRQLGGRSLAEMTSEEHRAIGAVWLERRFRAYRAELQRQGKDASHIGTLVGQPGSPLETEADYQAGRETLWGFWEAVKAVWTPEVERNFKGLMNLDPDDNINSPSQIQRLPLNAIALTESAPDQGVVGVGARPGMGGLRINKPGFTRAAELSAPAYDIDITHMMQRTLNLGVPAARRAEFMRTAIDAGVLAEVGGRKPPPQGSYQATANGKYIAKTDQPAPTGWQHAENPNLPKGWANLERVTETPKGWSYLGIDPAGGLPGLDPNARYYAHPDVFRDVVQGLGIGERPGQTIGSGLRPVVNAIYQFALMSPVELSTHVANHFTSLFRSGMGIPIYNLKDSFSNAWKVYKAEPEIMRRVMEMAKIGASFEHEAHGGLLKSLVNLGKYLPGTDPAKVEALAEKTAPVDPTNYINTFTSKLINVMQKAVRVQLEDAFDSQVRSGALKDGQTAKRDFINSALGNYSAQASNRITQFIKDTGLQGFVTAASTFTAQGAKVATGGAINAPATSAQAGVQLRATAMLKLLPVLAIGPVVNYLAHGQAFPENIPAFAVKTRDDEDDKIHYIDPLKFTGLRRGWRATGMNALIERFVQGEASGNVFDRAMKDWFMTGEHLVAGPPMQFFHTAATGENALGHRVAAPISHATTAAGASAAERKGLLPAGSSEYKENLKAAALGVNPLIGSFTQADRPRTVRTFAENLTQSAGPFGEITRNAPKRKK